MEQKWFEEQAEQLGTALAEQGLGLPVPMVIQQTFASEPAENLAGMIDQTLLKPEATEAQIARVVQEAREFGFAAVCIHPRYVAFVRKLLGDSPVKTCTVIGFPFGVQSSLVKVFEVRDAVADGADELDMVLPIGCLKGQGYAAVYHDIVGVVQAAKERLVKVILETSLLTNEEIGKACLLAKMAGADFVKTSTGFGSGGATVEDIRLMRCFVGPEMGIKASGGVRDKDAALAMVRAGATRIGTSNGVNIVEGSAGQGSEY